MRVGHAVVALLWEGPRVVGVRLDDDTEIRARAVVMALGPWTHTARAWMRADKLPPIVPIRSHRILLSPRRAGAPAPSSSIASLPPAGVRAGLLSAAWGDTESEPRFSASFGSCGGMSLPTSGTPSVPTGTTTPCEPSTSPTSSDSHRVEGLSVFDGAACGNDGSGRATGGPLYSGAVANLNVVVPPSLPPTATAAADALGTARAPPSLSSATATARAGPQLVTHTALFLKGQSGAASRGAFPLDSRLCAEHATAVLRVDAATLAFCPLPLMMKRAYCRCCVHGCVLVRLRT